MTENADRVDEVIRIRLDGAQFHDIRAYAAEAKWNLTDRQLWELVHHADEVLVARVERKRSRTLAHAIGRREALFARAVNSGDYSVALATLKDLANLQGLYPSVAELVKVVKAQDALIKELESRGRPVEEGAKAIEGSEGGEGRGRGRARTVQTESTTSEATSES